MINRMNNYENEKQKNVKIAVKLNKNTKIKNKSNDTRTHLHCTRYIVDQIVLERPSSQMSYLDHFLKESGTATNTTHTSSSIAINMVSDDDQFDYSDSNATATDDTEIITISISSSHHRTRYLNRPKEQYKINHRPVRLPTTSKWRSNVKVSQMHFKVSSMIAIISRSQYTSTQIHSRSHKWCYTIRAIRWKVKRATSKIIRRSVCPVRRAIWVKIHW